MKMLISSVFGHQVGGAFEPHPQVQGIIGCGVEIELENVSNTNQLQSEFWVTTADGSLRNNGREFVFNGPRGGSELFLACIDLDSFLVKQNPDASWRCSTHVHVDMRWATVEQLKKVIVANIVYEKFLFRMSGMNRYRNNFCAAIGFAQDQLNTLAQHWNWRDEDFVRGVSGTWDKYSALNLRPLSTFGSIEFRSSNAEWRKGKLIRLCNRFLGLVEYASSFEGSAADLILDLSDRDPRQVMRKGFQNTALPEGWQEDISTGIKLAHDLMTFSRMPESIPNVGTVHLNHGPFVPIARDNARWIRDTLTISHGYRFLGTFRNSQHNGRTYTSFPLKGIRDIIREHNVSIHDFLDDIGIDIYEGLTESQDVDGSINQIVPVQVQATRASTTFIPPIDWTARTESIRESLRNGASLSDLLRDSDTIANLAAASEEDEVSEDDEEFF
ncbi:MAG: hypothetical protein ACRC6V_05060 [Bacteroidales bacterium]